MFLFIKVFKCYWSMTFSLIQLVLTWGDEYLVLCTNQPQTQKLDEYGLAFEVQTNSSFNLFKMFKYFFIILFKTIQKNQLVKSTNILLFNIKPINPKK